MISIRYLFIKSVADDLEEYGGMEDGGEVEGGAGLVVFAASERILRIYALGKEGIGNGV